MSIPLSDGCKAKILAKYIFFLKIGLFLYICTIKQKRIPRNIENLPNPARFGKGEILKLSSFERLTGTGMTESVGIRIVDYCCLTNHIQKVRILATCKMALMDVAAVDRLLGCNTDTDYRKHR